MIWAEVMGLRSQSGNGRGPSAFFAGGMALVIAAGQQPIPGYQLTEQLGAGAFGVVWEAKDAKGKPVALKFIDCRTKSSRTVSAEIRVLRALQELRHPHIIQLQSVYAAGQYIVLRMERADGNLNDLRAKYQVERRRNIPPDHLLELLAQTAEALDFLAGLKLPEFNCTTQGLQHCDVKPANLLILGDKVKVADFGLCAGTSWQTHKNAWKGTFPYAAPELFKGQAAVGTDQFALAVTYLELIAGERCFFKHVPRPDDPPSMPVDLTKVRSKEVPILARALHPFPTMRWPSCQTFVAALREATLAPRCPIQLPTPPVRSTLQKARA
jgi:serine/threonine protein kinase